MRLKRCEYVRKLRHFGVSPLVLQPVGAEPHHLGDYSAKAAKPSYDEIGFRGLRFATALAQPGNTPQHRKDNG